MSDLKIQAAIEMTSEGAESAFDRVGQKADEMSRKVTQTSAQAGQAVDQIGTGANRNADEFTRAEGRIVSSIKRATTELQNLGKTASQRLELRIDTQGLDRAKFEPLLANLRELEAAQNRVAGSGRSFAGGLQNTSYQLQDFIVQVNGGTDATRALAMQLPQMLVGFGAIGAGIGVVAALLPNIITLFGDSANEAESLKDAMSGLDSAIGDVGRTAKTFDMEGLYEQFNAANDVTRQAIIEQAKFQQALIETERLVARKSFNKSIDGIGEFSTWDKIKSAAMAAAAMRASTETAPLWDEAAEVVDLLGVTRDVASELAPVLRGLEDGTVDVGTAFAQFGTKLLAGNKESVALAKSMRDLARGELDAAAASKAVEEALERMAKGHVRTKKEADEAAKASKSYADETQRMAEAARDLVASLLGQSSGLSADFFKKWETLGQAYKAGAISLQDLTDVQAALLAQQPAMKQAAKDAGDYAKAIADTVGKLEERALTLETELQTYGLTKSQIERTTVVRLEEVRAMAQANGATEDYLRNLDREIDARKRIASATSGIEVQEANARAAKDAEQEWMRTADNIEKALVDALMEGGKSGAEYIEGLFRSMVLRPVIQAIVQPIAGGITSAMGFGAPGQGGSLLGSLGSAASAYQTISGLNALITGSTASTLGGYVGSLGSAMGSSTLTSVAAGMKGATLAPGLAGPTTQGASGAMGFGANAGVASGYAAGILAGYGVGKTISGQYAVGGNSNTTVVAGTAIGAAIAGPIGAAVGGAIGGVINRAFGVGKVTTTGSSYEGEYSLSGADLMANVQTKQKGGWFRSDKNRSYSRAIDWELDDALDAAIGMVVGATSAYADQLGLEADAIKGITESVKVNTLGRSAEDIQKDLEASIGSFGDKLAAALLGDGGLVRAGETASQTLAALAGSLVAVNQVFDTLETALMETGLSGADASRRLLDLFGTLDNFNAATSAYYQAFYSEQERTATAVRQLTEAFDALGFSLPTTRDGFRALVEAQILTTSSGRETYATLLSLAGAFDQVADSLNAALQILTLDAQTGVGGMINAVSTAMREAQSAARTWLDVSRSLRSQAAGLSPSNDRVRVGELAAALAITTGKALGGDIDAARSVGGDAAAYLDAYKGIAKDRAQYAAESARIRSSLNLVAGAGELEAANSAVQASLMQSQIDVLGELKNYLQNDTLDPAVIDGFRQRVEDFGAAINEYEKLSYADIKAGLDVTIDTIWEDPSLPDDIKRILAAEAEAISAQVDFVVGTDSLTPDQKWIAVNTQGELKKTIDFIVRTKPEKDLIDATLAVSNEIRKTISLVAGSGLSDELKAIALVSSNTVTKTVLAALDSSSSKDAIKLALGNLGDYQVSVNASIVKDGLSDAVKRIVLTQAGTYTAGVLAVLDAERLTEAQKRILLAQQGSYIAVIGATIDSKISDKHKELLLESSTTGFRAITLSATLPDGALSADSRLLLKTAGGNILRKLTATLKADTLTPDARLLLTTDTRQVTRTLTGKIDLTNLTAKQRDFFDAVTGGKDGKLFISGDFALDPSKAFTDLFDGMGSAIKGLSFTALNSSLSKLVSAVSESNRIAEMARKSNALSQWNSLIDEAKDYSGTSVSSASAKELKEAKELVARYLSNGNIQSSLGVTAPANIASLAVYQSSISESIARLDAANVSNAAILGFAQKLASANSGNLRAGLWSTEEFLKERGDYTSAATAQDAAVQAAADLQKVKDALKNLVSAYPDLFSASDVTKLRAFASGGVFTNSIVRGPTAFSMGLMGESGPEAVMPLTNVNGSLGVRAELPGLDALIEETRAMREEIAQLKAASAATARHTHETNRTLNRVTNGGNAMLTEATA